MATPVTRYAKSGDVHVACQVFGNGPIDLVFVLGFVSRMNAPIKHMPRLPCPTAMIR